VPLILSKHHDSNEQSAASIRGPVIDKDQAIFLVAGGLLGGRWLAFPNLR
jgi:hypothetical protein